MGLPPMPPRDVIETSYHLVRERLQRLADTTGGRFYPWRIFTPM